METTAAVPRGSRAAAGPGGFAETERLAETQRGLRAGGGGGSAPLVRSGNGNAPWADFSWRMISAVPGVVDAAARPAPPAFFDVPGADRGSLFIECRFDDVLDAPRTLLRCEQPPGKAAGAVAGTDLVLIADPRFGLGLFLRRGGQAFRAEVAWPGDGPPALSRILFYRQGAAGDWTFAVEDRGAGRFAFASGTGAVALPLRDPGVPWADARQTRDPAVTWFGLAEGRVPFGLPCGLGADALVLTPNGHVAAAQLRAGDLVITRDRGAQPVRAAGVVAHPAHGANVPVILRSNYLGARLDLRILPQQRIALAGAEVEYLFGEDEVLVEAGCFTDDRAVIRTAAGGSVRLAFVLLDEPDLICANGCWIESLWHCAQAARPERLAASGLGQVAGVPVHERTARRVLKDYEARTLASMRRQVGMIT